jgi:hypothetical protein
MKTKLSQSVLMICIALALVLSACGTSAPAATPTVAASATPTSTLTPTFTPTVTLTPTKTPTPTATPNLTATQQYNDFMVMVQKVYDAGQISSLDGTYKKLDGFRDQLARSYGYRWLPTGEAPKNFILRADFDWEVANQKNNSGCGYVFRQTSEDHYYMMAMDALNGVLFFYTKTALDFYGQQTTTHTPIRATKKERLPDLGNNPYQAKVTLVINESSAYMYINDEFYSEHRFPKDREPAAGTLSYMVLTGSATDFGTRCKISNVEEWIIAP